MIWWLIPLVATLLAWMYLRVAGAGRIRARRLPEPGTPEDAADLARFAEALRAPMPGRAVAGPTRAPGGSAAAEGTGARPGAAGQAPADRDAEGRADPGDPDPGRGASDGRTAGSGPAAGSGPTASDFPTAADGRATVAGAATSPRRA